MHLLWNFLCLITEFLLTSTSGRNNNSVLHDIAKNGQYPLGCSMRVWNFTATNRDIYGRECRRNISTTACYGSCDTYEIGSHYFPNTVGQQIVCNYNRSREVTVVLNDCDKNVKLKSKNWTYLEALSCVCDRCNPRTTLCVGVSEK